jgi:hypothetical protein
MVPVILAQGDAGSELNKFLKLSNKIINRIIHLLWIFRIIDAADGDADHVNIYIFSCLKTSICCSYSCDRKIRIE